MCKFRMEIRRIFLTRTGTGAEEVMKKLLKWKTIKKYIV